MQPNRPHGEKANSAYDIIAAIDKNLSARGQAEHDDALAEFMTALDYYIDRQRQSWVR